MFQCRVCGYRGLSKPPYERESGASDEICSSCGIQYGFDDAGRDEVYEDMMFKEKVYTYWRNRWIQSGCKWYSKGVRPPKNWDPHEQLKRVLH
jgi:hypothetical protein